MFFPYRAKQNQRSFTVLHTLLACLCFMANAGSAETAAESSDDKLAKTILEKSDQVRFPADGFEVGVAIDTKNANGESETRKYRVLSKGNENTVVMITEPASERGQIMLMKGRDLWIFLPAVSQPVRVSMSQRLTGEVANGDLARANFAADYTPKLLRTETVSGEPMYVLELNAVDRGVTYRRVLYWVRQANYWPYKAEFYSLSDRLLKTCFYQDYQPLGGKVRPTKLLMQDALKEDEQSVMTYTDLRLKNIPDKVFTKDYLKHLE